MSVALWLLALQGLIGAFDTVYYHEWRARLPARGRGAGSELQLHAARDLLYAVLFASLPWMAWQGSWALVLAGVIVVEIILTLTDVVVEVAVRKPFGDVYPGERVTHAVMGILYGAMGATLIPVVMTWRARPTALVVEWADVPRSCTGRCLRWPPAYSHRACAICMRRSNSRTGTGRGSTNRRSA